MQQEPSLVPTLEQIRQRYTATLLLDSQLRIQQHSATLSQWLNLPQKSWLKQPITAVFPELIDWQELLENQLTSEDALLLFPLNHQRPGQNSDPLCIQVERFVGDSTHYLLTLIPQAPISADDHKSEIELLEKQNRTLQLLNKAGRILTESLEMEVVLDRILQVINQIIGVEGSSVWLWHDMRPNQLVCRAAYFPHHVTSLLGQRLEAGQGVAGWVGLNGESAVVLDAAKDGRFSTHIDTHSGFKTESLIAVPITLRDHTLGVLEVVNKFNSAFDEQDLAVTETLAASAAVAIDNARLVETLQQQMHDLQAQNAELDAFDHTVAHDLQNPLSLIVGFADVLRQAPARTLTDANKQHAIDMILMSSQKMSNIIHELLLLSSVRKSDVETVPLDMAKIVDAALMRLSHLSDSYSATVLITNQWPVALGYPAWVEEVWENYISNAIKYGGRPPHVEIGATLLEDIDMVKFWVRDNGAGLTEEEQARLFTPFTRLSDIKITGQGLGLSIVQRIIDKLDGQVSIENDANGGSIFSFMLPAANL